MKTGKYIHLVLVALLCFGQWVTSIHAVGHLDLTEGPVRLLIDAEAGTAPYAEFDAAGSAHDHTHTILAHAADDEHDHSGTPHNHIPPAHGHADGSNGHAFESAQSETESDCGLYHTYLNQVSVLCAPTHGAMAVLRQSTALLYTFTRAAGVAVRNLPIRGPPAIS